MKSTAKAAAAEHELATESNDKIRQPPDHKDFDALVVV